MSQSAGAIVSFGDLYQRMVAERPFVSSLLSGHLAIEFMLRRLVRQYDPRLAKHADTLRHHALISLNHQIGTISGEQRDVLYAINSLRNKFAHQITFEPSMDALRHLWQQASEAFSDMTDGIEQGIGELGPAADLNAVEEPWVLSELFVQICYDLHNEYIKRGGDHDAI